MQEVFTILIKVEQFSRLSGLYRYGQGVISSVISIELAAIQEKRRGSVSCISQNFSFFAC